MDKKLSVKRNAKKRIFWCFSLANVAFEKSVWASSENHVNTVAASVDGDADTCFSTAVGTNPWWTVDLDAEYTVTAVKLQLTDNSAGKELLIKKMITPFLYS